MQLVSYAKKTIIIQFQCGGLWSGLIVSISKVPVV